MILSQKGRTTAPVAEDTDRIYHEIKQCLRLTGVPDYFKIWAERPGFLARVWEAALPNAETRAFEEAADRLRAEAVGQADGLGRLSALGPAQLGESQAYQAEAAVMLYHYIGPKLMILNSSLLASRGADPGGVPPGPVERVERGAPERMPILETVDERTEDHSVSRVFRDYKKTLAASRVEGGWRTLALWPRYLETAWERLSALLRAPEYEQACERLRRLSHDLSCRLPYPAVVSLEHMRAGEEPLLIAQAEQFDAALPGQLLAASLLALDWQAPEILRRSPFPARPRAGKEAR